MAVSFVFGVKLKEYIFTIKHLHNNNNNNNSYITLYPVKIYKLAALYIINIKSAWQSKKVQVL